MRVEIASSHVTGLYKRRAHSLCNNSQVETPNYRYWASCAAASSYHGSCLGACITNTQRPFCRYQYTTSIWHQYTTYILSVHILPMYIIKTQLPCWHQYTYLLSLTIHHPPTFIINTPATVVINTPPTYCRYQYISSLLASIPHLPTRVINTPTHCRYQYTTYLLSLSIHHLPTVVINTPHTCRCYQYTSSLLSLSIHHPAYYRYQYTHLLSL